MNNVVSFEDYKARRLAISSTYEVPTPMQMQLAMWRLWFAAAAVQGQMGLILTSRGQ